MTKQTYNPPWLIPLLLGGLSLMIRLSVISLGPFNVDCLNLAVKAQNTLGQHQLHFLNGTGYPLTILLGSLFVALTGLAGNSDPVFAVNLMSVVLSSLTIVCFYLFIQTFLDRKTALFSSILFSLYPAYLGLSTYGMSHTPSIFFLILGLCFIQEYARMNIRSLLFFGAGCFGCMGASRVQEYALIAIPVTLLFWRMRKQHPRCQPDRLPDRRFWRDTAFMWASSAIFAFLFYIPLLVDAPRTGYLIQLRKYWDASTAPNFLGFFSPALFDSFKSIFFGLTPIGAITVLIGFLLILKDDKQKALSLLAWFILPLLFLGNLSMSTDRFIMVCLIPLFIFSGYFFAYLYAFPAPRFRLLAFFAFGIITVTMFANIYPVLLFRHRHALLPDFARFVKRVTDPSAKIITGDEAPFISYYGNRDIVFRPFDAIRIPQPHLNIFKRQLDQLLAEEVPVYITSSGLFSYDPGKGFSDFIKNNYELDYAGETLSEGWHQGAARLRIGVEKLYRLRKKPAERHPLP